jgi:hypothetical protein
MMSLTLRWEALRSTSTSKIQNMEKNQSSSLEYYSYSGYFFLDKEEFRGIEYFLLSFTTFFEQLSMLIHPS